MNQPGKIFQGIHQFINSSVPQVPTSPGLVDQEIEASYFTFNRKFHLQHIVLTTRFRVNRSLEATPMVVFFPKNHPRTIHRSMTFGFQKSCGFLDPGFFGSNFSYHGPPTAGVAQQQGRWHAAPENFTATKKDLLNYGYPKRTPMKNKDLRRPC